MKHHINMCGIVLQHVLLGNITKLLEICHNLRHGNSVQHRNQWNARVMMEETEGSREQGYSYNEQVVDEYLQP